MGWFNMTQDGYRRWELASRSCALLRLSPTAEATSVIRVIAYLLIGISASCKAATFKITTQQTRAERRGVAKDMGGRLGDAASIIGEGGGERLPLFLTFPYTQIARHAGYRFQSLYHLGQKRIRAELTFTLEPQGRASTPA